MLPFNYVAKVICTQWAWLFRVEGWTGDWSICSSPLLLLGNRNELLHGKMVCVLWVRVLD